MSLRISSHFPYLPSSPRRQCRFFGVISADTVGGDSLRCLFALRNSGIEIVFQCIILPVPLIVVCINDFWLCLCSKNLNGYLTEFLFFGDFVSAASCRSSVFVRAITMWLVISLSAPLPTYIGILGRFGAEMDNSDQIDRNDFPSFIILVSSVLSFRPW